MKTKEHNIYFCITFLIFTALFTSATYGKSKIESISMSEPYGTAVWSWDASKFSKNEMAYILYLNPYTIPPNENPWIHLSRISKTEICCKNTLSVKQEAMKLKQRLEEYKKIKNPLLIKLVKYRCESLETRLLVVNAMILFCETDDPNVLLVYKVKGDLKLQEIVSQIKLESDSNKKIDLIDHAWRNRIFELNKTHDMDQQEQLKYWKKFESKYLKKQEIHEIDTF